MPLAGTIGELTEGYAAEADVRTHAAEVRPPYLYDPPRRSQLASWAAEQVLVWALIAQATIERLHEAVLLQLARSDVLPLDPGVLAPGEDSMTG